LVVSDIAAQLADIGQAVAMAEASRERLPISSPERAAAAAQLARWHMLAYDRAAALRLVDEALEIAESLEDWGVLAEALVTKGTVLVFAQRQQEGTSLVEAGLRLAREHDLPVTAVRALNNLSNFLLAQGRAEEALAQIRQALELARSRGDRQWQALIAGDESLALLALGRWDEALEVAARVVELGAEELSGGLDISIFEARLYSARGQTEGLVTARDRSLPYVDSLDGQLRAASRIAVGIAAHEDGRPEEALDLLRDLGEGNEAYVHRFAFFEAGRAALASGRDAELEQMVTAIVDAPPGGTSPLSRALAQGFAGVLASRRGEHPEALVSLDAAVAWLREIGYPFELAWALLERGRALAAAGQDQEAGASLDEAREIYRRLRAEPWLRRADEVLARTSSATEPGPATASL
jgi:tetratricopeptide (TPR) repeat protein